MYYHAFIYTYFFIDVSYGNGSYNLEKVLNFSSCREESLNLVEVFEQYLVSCALLGLKNTLKFTTLSENIFVYE